MAGNRRSRWGIWQPQQWPSLPAYQGENQKARHNQSLTPDTALGAAKERLKSTSGRAYSELGETESL